ncbi:MAG: holliday junction helicase RuvA [Thermotogaceae bacterium]|nr:holliday junction helicase RuvA [Thermotogaceae bacterium]MDN5337649.1 holliday junction helicase RuvA [Thermotogaceae bacterium]
MVKFLEGKVEKLTSEGLILNVSGIGFLIKTNQSFLRKLENATEEKIRVYVSLIFNPNNFSFELYGFENIEQCELFEALRSVSKIGPKIAMKIISSVEPKLVVSMIVNEDVESLSKLPGIGKKGAERIVMELKNKIDHDFSEIVYTNNFSEAIEALKNLGYSNTIASQAVKTVMENSSEPVDTSVLIKRALKYIMTQGEKKNGGVP